MKSFIKILFLSFIISCSGQEKDQSDALSYCNDKLYLGDLQINTACNKKSIENYTVSEIKQTFSLPITKEVNEPANEDTGGNSTYWYFVFKDNLGKVSFEVYDEKLPEFYLTHPDVPVTVGTEAFNIGDSISKVKTALGVNGLKQQGDNTLFIFIDYNVLAFGFENDSIKYIAFNGNYF